jgi:hypothetical protein
LSLKNVDAAAKKPPAKKAKKKAANNAGSVEGDPLSLENAQSRRQRRRHPKRMNKATSFKRVSGIVFSCFANA